MHRRSHDNIRRKTYQTTIIKCEEDGFFYLYGTEDTHNMPIYRSRNLIDWIFVGTAFTEASRPKCVGPGTGESGNQSAGMWAPDINYINGQYVLYYGIGVWGQGNIKSGVAVATADRPEGPFIDRGVILHPRHTGREQLHRPVLHRGQRPQLPHLGQLCRNIHD